MLEKLLNTPQIFLSNHEKKKKLWIYLWRTQKLKWQYLCWSNLRPRSELMECTFTPEVKVDGMYLYARGHSWWNVPLSIFGFFFKGFFKKASERWRARLTIESASSSKSRINSNYSIWAMLISEVKGWLLNTSEYCQQFGCHAPYYFRNSGCVFAFSCFK